MPRTLLTDEYWPKLLAILLELGLYDKPNLRNVIEGILYRMRTGCPWRDLPASFGKFQAVYNCFNRWSKKGIIQEIFLRAQIEEEGSKANIPYKRDREEKNKDMDWYLYKIRHLVENAFARLKHYRAIATR